MMGETKDHNSKKTDEHLAESLKKEALNSSNTTGPIPPEWTLLLISHDDELVEFDGFNLNYAEAKGILITFKMPILITGTFL